MPATSYDSEMRIWCLGYCLHIFVKRESGSKIMPVFLTHSFGRSVLPLKLLLWPRICISLLSVLKIKFCVIFVLVQRDDRFRDFDSSCFVSPGLSEMSQQEAFSSVSSGVTGYQLATTPSFCPRNAGTRCIHKQSIGSAVKCISYKCEVMEGRILFLFV